MKIQKSKNRRIAKKINKESECDYVSAFFSETDPKKLTVKVRSGSGEKEKAIFFRPK